AGRGAGNQGPGLQRLCRPLCPGVPDTGLFRRSPAGGAKLPDGGAGTAFAPGGFSSPRGAPETLPGNCLLAAGGGYYPLASGYRPAPFRPSPVAAGPHEKKRAGGKEEDDGDRGGGAP